MTMNDMANILKSSQRLISKVTPQDSADGRGQITTNTSKRNVTSTTTTQANMTHEVKSKRLIESTVHAVYTNTTSNKVLEKQPSSIISSAQTKLKAVSNLNQKHLDRGKSGIAEYSASKQNDRGALQGGAMKGGYNIPSDTGQMADQGRHSASKSPVQKSRMVRQTTGAMKDTQNINLVPVTQVARQTVKTTTQQTESSKILRKKTGLEDERMNLSIIRSISPIPGDASPPVKVVSKATISSNSQRVSPTKPRQLKTAKGS